MRALIFVALFALVTLAVATPAEAAPPRVQKCWWIINGPTLFNRVCVDSTSTECTVYQETWTWEGGYRKKCYPGPVY